MYSLLVIFLQYDTEKYKNSFIKLKELLGKSPCNIIYVNVNNKVTNPLDISMENNCYFISGDNSCWEFSGWDAGMKYAQQKEIESDAILFINDAWMAYGWNFLNEIKLEIAVERLKRKDMLIGHIDTKGYPLRILDFDVSTWMCTNSFLTNENVYLKLGSLVSYGMNDPNKLFKNPFDAKNIFNSQSMLSESYENMVVEWLTKEWHGRLDITANNWMLFKSKAVAMINESLLSARARMEGIEVSSYRNYE